MVRACAVWLLLVIIGGCASAPPAMKIAVVPESLNARYEQFQYAPAVRAGNLLFLSGVVATVTEADHGQIEPAIERAFDEIELVLSEAGASWRDVVDVTSYMTDLDRQIGPLWAIKGRRVSAPYPAWTAIGVDRLYGGETAIIEIKVTALLNQRSR